MQTAAFLEHCNLNFIPLTASFMFRHGGMLQTDLLKKDIFGCWYIILINNLSFWSDGKRCPRDCDEEKQNVNLLPLLPNLPPFHLMYSAGSQFWVGGFTTVPSLLSSSQSLLSDSSLYCLSFQFLDPRCFVNRSQFWVGVSTSCYLTGTPLITPLWNHTVGLFFPFF